MNEPTDFSEVLQAKLVMDLGRVIKDHYKTRPQLERISVYEVLQALAFHAALVLRGTGPHPEAVEYFLQRFNDLLHENN